jgi:hypothetical protein
MLDKNSVGSNLNLFVMERLHVVIERRGCTADSISAVFIRYCSADGWEEA